jgi:hypothetical protein
MDLVGLEELPHRLLKLILFKSEVLGLVLLGEDGWRIVVGVLALVDPAVLFGVAPEDIKENALRRRRAREPVEVGD